MRREERVTVQGPVKKQQPDGLSHGGGGGRWSPPPPWPPKQSPGQPRVSAQVAGQPCRRVRRLPPPEPLPPQAHGWAQLRVAAPARVPDVQLLLQQRPADAVRLPGGPWVPVHAGPDRDYGGRPADVGPVRVPGLTRRAGPGGGGGGWGAWRPGNCSAGGGGVGPSFGS